MKFKLVKNKTMALGIACLILFFTTSIIAYTTFFFRWKRFEVQPLVGFHHNLEMFLYDLENPPHRIVSDVLWATYASWNNEGNSNLTVADFGQTSNRTVANDNHNSVIATLDLDILQYLFFSPNAIAGALPWGRVQSLEITDCDIMIFPRPFFIDQVSSSKLSLPTTFKHEVGHCIGLLHSSANPNESDSNLKDALMYYSLYNGQIKTLNADDTAGLHSLYGQRINFNDLLSNFCRAINIDPADPWCIVVACFAIGYCHL